MSWSASSRREVTEPLRLLTHDPAVPYRDYIDTFVVDPVARTVKRADLMHNLDETRFEGCGRIDEVELSRRRERYRDALGMLDEGERSTSFLSLTLPQGSLRARLRQRCLQRIGARCNAMMDVPVPQHLYLYVVIPYTC